MTFDEIGIVVAIVTAILAVAENRRHSLSAAAEQRERFAKLEVKVDTLWGFLLRRAEVEATTVRLADKNSPLEVRPESLELFRNLAPALRNYYTTEGFGLTAPELALNIEEKFGREITDTISKPNDLTFGACLIVAVAVASGDNVVDLSTCAG